MILPTRTGFIHRCDDEHWRAADSTIHPADSPREEFYAQLLAFIGPRESGTTCPELEAKFGRSKAYTASAISALRRRNLIKAANVKRPIRWVIA